MFNKKVYLSIATGGDTGPSGESPTDWLSTTINLVLKKTPCLNNKLRFVPLPDRKATGKAHTKFLEMQAHLLFFDSTF